MEEALETRGESGRKGHWKPEERMEGRGTRSQRRDGRKEHWKPEERAEGRGIRSQRREWRALEARGESGRKGH